MTVRLSPRFQHGCEFGGELRVSRVIGEVVEFSRIGIVIVEFASFIPPIGEAVALGAEAVAVELGATLNLGDGGLVSCGCRIV